MNNPKHHLMPRDWELLKLLGEYGCVSSERIKVQFWNENPNSRAHYRRLGILKKANFIETVYGDGLMPIGYRLTRSGKRLLADIPESSTLPSNRRSYKTQYEHDQLLIDIRRIFEKSPLVRNFQSEAEIKRTMFKTHAAKLDWKNASTIPDAMFDFEVPGQKRRIAIELELTQKSHKRYVKILTSHLLSPDWGVVFYIIKGEELLNRLRATLKTVKLKEPRVMVARRVNGLYFCSLEKFLEFGTAAPFSNEKGEISLKSIEHNFGFDGVKAGP